MTLQEQTDYQATMSSAALINESNCGRIFMRGRDRADLLHRLSTNDILKLHSGAGTHTVLTTPIGRIIDLLTVHTFEDELLLITSPGQGSAVFGHLRQNIFFNDQVTLAAAGRSHAQLALYGPAASDIVRSFGADTTAIPMYHWFAAQIAGVAVTIASRPPIGGPSFTLFVPSESLETVQASILAAGATILSPETLDILRVERGYPAFGHELSQEYIPLETGLTDAVCFTKGCYVGQEIIARMESRNRLAKSLRGLKLNGPVSTPAKLEVEGREAGDLTSAVSSPRLGQIGLAYVRIAFAEPGTTIKIAGTGVGGTVVELPFVA